MKFSDKTLSILKSFSSINPSIKIMKGNMLSTISPTKTILVKTTVDDTFDDTFCIYDLSQFLGTLSMFENPDVDLDTSAAIIKSGRQKVTFRFADESLLKVMAPTKDLSFPEPDVTFDLTETDLSSIIKATAVLTLPEIAIVGEDGKLILRAVNTKDVGSNKFDIELGDTDKNFVAVFKPEYLTKLINGTYKVDLSSKRISRFTGDGITYWISMETNSSFD